MIPPGVVKELEAEAELGARLRALRMSRGLSLRAVAGLAAVTPGALSQIENGKSSPSVSTLKKILGAMGTTMGEFFSAGERRDDGSRVVFRAGELVKAAPGKGLRCLALPPAGTARALQLLHETWGPGADTGSEPYTHEGEEGGFCLSGSMEITVAGRRELLGPGDAYYYSSKLPHRWRNVGRTPAMVISACTPPTF